MKEKGALQRGCLRKNFATGRFKGNGGSATLCVKKAPLQEKRVVKKRVYEGEKKKRRL